MSTVRTERIAAETVEAYRGTFAAVEQARASGEELPPGWEGVFFPFSVAMDDLRPDGTPARDGILPEIDLPRRLYAGEDTVFIRPLRIGDDVTQTAAVGAVTEKSGSRGRLVFADVEREFSVDGETAIRSVWHDVFLEAADPDAPVRPPRTDDRVVDAADWVDVLTLDARQLFRFSALTFNTHLIHYDRAWAQDVEGLPDLLVHGPLTRILLMDAARRHAPDRTVAALGVRAVSPTLVGRRVRLAGSVDAGVTRVTAVDDDDVVLATADVTWA